jgi:hypothetical protein
MNLPWAKIQEVNHGKSLFKHHIGYYYSNFLFASKVVITMEDLIVGMHISLVETKQENFNVKLVAKHYIFTSAITVGASICKGHCANAWYAPPECMCSCSLSSFDVQ